MYDDICADKAKAHAVVKSAYHPKRPSSTSNVIRMSEWHVVMPRFYTCCGGGPRGYSVAHLTSGMFDSDVLLQKDFNFVTPP